MTKRPDPAVPASPRRALSKKDLLDIDGITEDDIRLVLDTAESMREINQRAIKKVPTLRGKLVANLFFENSTRTRFSFEIAERRLSADSIALSAVGHVGRQGRDAARHGAEPHGDGARRDRDPALAVRGAAPPRAEPAVRRRERGRRDARAPDAGAPRRVHDPPREGDARRPPRRDLRRRPAQPRRAVERRPPHEDGRGRDALRPADAPASRDRADGRARCRPASRRRSTAPTS